MIVTRRHVKISREEFDEILRHQRLLIDSNDVLKDDVRELQQRNAAQAETIRNLTAELASERERLSYPWEAPPREFHSSVHCLGHEPGTTGEVCPHEDPPMPELDVETGLTLERMRESSQAYVELSPSELAAEHSRKLAAGDPDAWGSREDPPTTVAWGPPE